MNKELQRFGIILLLSAGVLLVVSGCGSRKQAAMVSGESLLQEKAPVAKEEPTDKGGLPLEGSALTQEAMDLGGAVEELPAQAQEPPPVVAEPEMPAAPKEELFVEDSQKQIMEEPIVPSGVPSGGPEPEMATSQLTFSPSTPSFPAPPSTSGTPTPPSTVPPLSYSPEGPALPLGLQPEGTAAGPGEGSTSEAPAGGIGKSSTSEAPTGLTFHDLLPELPPAPSRRPSPFSSGPEGEGGMESAGEAAVPEEGMPAESGQQLAKAEPMVPGQEEHVPAPHEELKPLGAFDMGAAANGEKVESPLAPVFFDFDQYTIRPDAASVLETNAQLLKTTYADKPVLIEGHCDERGTQEYNFVLGERRARAVKSYLVDLGVQGSRLQIVSYGEDRPFCLEHTPSCWQENRRGQFVLR